MFDIGLSEITLILVMGLIVLGPERLPIAIRTVAKWIKALRELSSGVQHTLAQELKINELQGEIQKLGESTRAALNVQPNQTMQTELDNLKLTIAQLQHQLNGTTPLDSSENTLAKTTEEINQTEITDQVVNLDKLDGQADNLSQMNFLHGVPIVSDEDEAEEDFEHYTEVTTSLPVRENCHPPRSDMLPIHEEVNLVVNTPSNTGTDLLTKLNNRSDNAL